MVKLCTQLKWVAALFVLAGAVGSVPAEALTLPEGIPDFSLDPTRVTVRSAQSGAWSNPATWQGGQVPTSNQIVRIVLGHTVTIDDTVAVAYTLAVDGKLAFAANLNTRLKVTNLQVMAGESGMGTPGVLEIGTAAAPVAAGVTAEIIIANSPLGGSVADPEQFGTGLMVLGRMTAHGTPRTPTFTRLAVEPRAGNTTLILSEAAIGWRAGDRVVLPDTRHIKETEVTGGGWINAVNQWEERTVAAISADGKTITINSALQYDHLGARDLNGALDFLPHVGNLTRNVIVRSESATGTRGHTIATHMANVDIRHVLFKDLGRTTYLPLNDTTNHIGRYPVHMHHLSGPLPTPANGYQFTFIGNAVDGGSVETTFKWGLAVHATHYGLVQDNVVYNYNGASIATEDGSESFNVFDHNFALRGMGEPSDSVSEARMALGTEGVGFWLRGPNNFVRNNVAANFQNPTTEAAYGFVYQLRYLGNISVPNSKGAMDATQFTTRNGNNMPILQFENNEAYGAMQGGFTLWWVSSQDPQPATNAQESLIKDLKLWNTYNKTVYMYPSQKITFDGLKIRGSFSTASRCCGDGVYFADYSSKGIIIRNSDIQGMQDGITAPEAGFGPEPNLIVQNTYLRNWANLNVPTNGSVNGCWMQNKLVVASNTRFDAPPGRALDAVSMVRDVSSAPECLGKLDEMRVYAYNGVATDNFQVYHSNTSVLPRPPSTCTPTTRAGINGLLCPIAALASVTPTVTLGAAPPAITTGQSSVLTWTATNATTVSINQSIGTVTASGTRSVSPAATTTYTVTATNTIGTATATATVSVASTDTTSPTIVSISPAAGATGVSAMTAVLATFSEAMTAGSITAATLVLRDVANVPVSAIVSYDSSTRVATLTPAQVLGTLKTYTATVVGGSDGVKDLAGNAMTGNYAASFTTADPARVTAGDFDGDGKTDVAVWRPSTGVWYAVRSSDGSVGAQQWGAGYSPYSDVPAPGDYDGDGRTDIAVWRSSTGVWYVLRSSDGGVLSRQWGASGDLPVPGDYDGDGRTDFAVWHPSTGVWDVIRSTNGGVITRQWGAGNAPYNDVPVPADYDGDRVTDFAVWRASTGVWCVIRSSDDAVAIRQWGAGYAPYDDIPVPGDYDGDGRSDIAIWRPAAGFWYVIRSSDGGVLARQWGAGYAPYNDVPVPGDYDGDLKTDIAIWRGSTGVWYAIRSSDGAVVSVQ